MGLIIPVFALVEQKHGASQAIGNLALAEIGVNSGTDQPRSLIGVNRSVGQQSHFSGQTAA